MASQLYFEGPWSILSTVCIGNVFLGFVVCGITCFNALGAVPIVSSVGGAIANGVCYYVYYGSSSPFQSAVASVFGNLFWLVQEASLLFYSYIILSSVLRDFRRRIFVCLFWVFMLSIILTRIPIVVFEIRPLLQSEMPLPIITNYLHIGHYSLIALLECISAYFMIDLFVSAKKTSLEAALQVGLFRYLVRSTEIRVAILAVLGITRTFTHAFRTPGPKLSNIASQLDLFIYTLTCLFPVVLYIDLLASKLILTNQQAQQHMFFNETHLASDLDYGSRSQRQFGGCGSL